MRLVVGLGNPGSGYAKNRHNVGFMAVDDFVRRHGFGPWRAKFQGQVSEGSIGGDKVLVLKPETYMNLSGQSVGAALRFHKLALDEVIVLHDELDLPAGRIRVKKGGGAGGHNGLKSIDAHLGKDYWRLRIGIGHPGDKDRVTGHVLSDFAKADAAWLDPLLEAIADHLPLLIGGQDSQFVNKVTVALAPPKAAGATAPAKPPAKPKDPAEPKDGI